MKHIDLCRWIDNQFVIQKRKKKPYLKLIGIAIAFMVVGFSSAGLLTYFARIQTNIDVEPVILVDGLSGNTINDAFTSMAGTTVNITHNVTNLHENNSIPVIFNVTQCDEGLNITIWTITNPPYQDITYNNCMCSANLEPLQTFVFNVSYTISPYANPDEDLSGTIQVEHL